MSASTSTSRAIATRIPALFRTAALILVAIVAIPFVTVSIMARAHGRGR